MREFRITIDKIESHSCADLRRTAAISGLFLQVCWLVLSLLSQSVESAPEVSQRVPMSHDLGSALRPSDEQLSLATTQLVRLQSICSGKFLKPSYNARNNAPLMVSNRRVYHGRSVQAVRSEIWELQVWPTEYQRRVPEYLKSQSIQVISLQLRDPDEEKFMCSGRAGQLVTRVNPNNHTWQRSCLFMLLTDNLNSSAIKACANPTAACERKLRPLRFQQRHHQKQLKFLSWFKEIDDEEEEDDESEDARDECAKSNRRHLLQLCPASAQHKYIAQCYRRQGEGLAKECPKLRRKLQAPDGDTRFASCRLWDTVKTDDIERTSDLRKKIFGSTVG